MTEFKIGDRVKAETPHGWKDGVVSEIHHNYAWSEETKYEIHGKELLMITSARLLKKVEA